MSFFYPNDSKFVEGKIEYNYPKKTVYKRDIKEKQTYSETIKQPNQYLELEGELINVKDKYLELDFSNKESQFRDLKMKSGNYDTKNLYLFGLLHNNISQYSNKSIVGELVIEHSKLGPKKHEVYTCFLLQNSDSNRSNSLDEIIDLADKKENTKNVEQEINLNKDVPPQTEVIYYEHNAATVKKHVYVFLKPIPVNTNSAKFLKTLTYKTSLFEVDAPMDKKYFSVDVTPKSSKDGFTSMFSSLNPLREGLDDYYLDCKPAGESDETRPSYAVPINSEYTQSKTKIDNLTIVSNLLLFILISVTVFFTFPPIYKSCFINTLISNGVTGADGHKRIAGIDILIIMLSFAIILMCLITGGLGFSSFFMIGICWFVIFIMSVLVLMMQKSSEDFWKLNTEDMGIPTQDYHGEVDNITSAFKNWFNLFFSGSGPLITIGLVLLLGVFIVIYTVVMKGLNAGQITTATMSTLFILLFISLFTHSFFVGPI